MTVKPSPDGSAMSSVQMSYFEQEDVLHLVVSEEPEAGSIEVSPNITAELNADGAVIGIEILDASTFIRKLIPESF